MKHAAAPSGETRKGKAEHGSPHSSGSSDHALLSLPQVMWPPDSAHSLSKTKIQDTDFMDDFAQNHVLTNLQALGKSRQEPWFILSQLEFGQYLRKPAYAAAVAECRLPLPRDLDTPQTPYSRGEADFVLFHRHRGVLVGEIKSIGRYQTVHNSAPAEDKDVAKRIEKAVTQLNKSVRVISHVISDVAPSMTMRATLFLPYVNQAQLRRVLTSDEKLTKVSMIVHEFLIYWSILKYTFLALSSFTNIKLINLQ